MKHSATAKQVGRPRTSSPEKKRLDAKNRQAKARRKQKIISVISKRLAIEVTRRERDVWLEFLAWAHDCGDNLLVSVEWDLGGGTRKFSELSAQLIEEELCDKGEVVRLSFI